jgi:MipA family protein
MNSPAMWRTCAHCAWLLAWAAAAADPAAAQEQDRGWIATVGAGGAIAPTYPGSRSYSLSPWPIIAVRRVDAHEPVFAVEEGGGFPILRAGRFIIGPDINIDGGRKDENVGAPLGEIGRSVELGLGASVFLAPNLRLHGEARKGIGGHGGILGSVGADLIAQPTGHMRISLGPRLRLGDARFMRAFYGVTAEQAANTGLPQHEVDGGIRSVGAVVGARQLLGRGWSLHAFGRHDRLVGTAANSPIVTTYGSRHQWGGGLGLSYSFRLR